MQTRSKPWLAALFAAAVTASSLGCIPAVATEDHDDHEGHGHRNIIETLQTQNHEDPDEHGEDHAMPTGMAAQVEESGMEACDKGGEAMNACASKEVDYSASEKDECCSEKKTCCSGKKSFWQKLKFWDN